ncbi:hypothetical protein CPAR01_00749 [Colletotrichum paranaense]|uniref:Transcription factor domain-containing protein n=1 Tax=Colletotrichum paranaense TaxID=1914294 RepID=A0ABQ9T4R6_9PEZI|nr:uncharacterized protein CPAR01_00749 [Colletotrichum paranaense]KAK1546782.1 hypothetical protein CPAR01_00749 [Colletotrichum paranaense]
MSGPLNNRPLLPLLNGQPHLPRIALHKRKRTQVLAACDGMSIVILIQTKSQAFQQTTDAIPRVPKAESEACRLCVSSQASCIYTVAEGTTHREAQKRKLISISVAHENSQRVLELIRENRDGVADDITRKLQESDDLQHSINLIADASLLLPKFHEGQGKFYNKSKVAEQLMIQPLISDTDRGDGCLRPSDHIMPISRWTKISRADTTLTHLVNAFWTWNNTLSHLIDRDLFVSSLESIDSSANSDRNGQFCSSLLVNAILAVSTLYANKVVLGSVSAETRTTLSRDFAASAFELLESEQHMSSLTLLQAAAVLWTLVRNEGSDESKSRCLTLQGLLKRTWSSVRLENTSYGLITSPREEGGIAEKMHQADSYITWGFYCFFSPLIMKTFERLGTRDHSNSWDSTSNVGKDPKGLRVFVAECNLCEIIAQFVTDHAANRLNRDHCTALYNKLTCWQLSLPGDLMAGNSVPESVLFLRATYDFIALKVLSVYLKQPETDMLNAHNAALAQIGHAGSMMASLCPVGGISMTRHEYWTAEYCFSVAKDLLPWLDSGIAVPTVRDTIGKACCILRDMSDAGVSGRAQALLLDITKQAKSSGKILAPQGKQYARAELNPAVTIHGVLVFDGKNDLMTDSTEGAFIVKFKDKIRSVELVMN